MVLGEPTDLEVPEALSRARELFAADRATQQLGIQLVRVGPGFAEMSMRVSEAMLNGHRIVHGGFIFLLADTAFAYAYRTHGVQPVSRHADVAFVAPAGEDDVLVAAAVERSRTPRTAIFDVTVRRDIDEIVGEFRIHGSAPSRPIEPRSASSTSRG